ncbi:hypothetical protein F4821DRAFT_226291, partial [Hypoxylon rubiginosum]
MSSLRLSTCFLAEVLGFNSESSLRPQLRTALAQVLLCVVATQGQLFFQLPELFRRGHPWNEIGRIAPSRTHDKDTNATSSMDHCRRYLASPVTGVTMRMLIPPNGYGLGMASDVLTL